MSIDGLLEGSYLRGYRHNDFDFLCLILFVYGFTDRLVVWRAWP